jgi:hypothetical protein
MHTLTVNETLQAIGKLVDAEFETEDKAERFDEMEQRLEAVGKLVQEALCTL